MPEQPVLRFTGPDAFETWLEDNHSVSDGGINLAQLQTTASYQAHDLAGIDLTYVDLPGGNFAGFAALDRSKPLGFPIAEIAADGSIKVLPNQIKTILTSGVLLEDGSELPADLIVFATGFKSVRESCRPLLGDVVDRLPRLV